MRRLQLVMGVVAIAVVFAGGAWYGLARADTFGSEVAESAAPVETEPRLIGGIPSAATGTDSPEVPVASAKAKAEATTKAKGKAKAKAGAGPNATQQLAAAAGAKARALAAPDPYSLRISSFNILGSQHTARGGQRAAMAPGTARAAWATDLIQSSGIDVVGFSELQRDQYSVLMSRTSGFSSYPGTSLGSAGIPTMVMWRTSRFSLVDASTLQIDFLGQRRLMPIVLLEERSSGRMLYVFNVHNSPVQDRGNHQRERDAQMAAEIATIRKLRATGHPVFFLGDMNEHAEVFCKVTGSTDLTSPAGGSQGGACRAPGVMRVDWIFGNGNWTGYDLLRNSQAKRITDHTVLVADVTVP